MAERWETSQLMTYIRFGRLRLTAALRADDGLERAYIDLSFPDKIALDDDDLGSRAGHCGAELRHRRDCRRGAPCAAFGSIDTCYNEHARAATELSYPPF